MGLRWEVTLNNKLPQGLFKLKLVQEWFSINVAVDLINMVVAWGISYHPLVQVGSGRYGKGAR